MAYDELPAWLRGHIHPYPGEEMEFAEAPPAATPVDTGGAANDIFTDKTFAGVSSDAPAAAFSTGADTPDDLQGLTGDLPWLSDVPDDAIPTPPTPLEDMGGEALDASWLLADEEPAPAAAPVTTDSAGDLRGLTGQLPWMQDADAAPDAQSAGEPAAFDDGGDGALDWLAASEEVAAPEDAAAPASAGVDDDLGWMEISDQLDAEVPADAAVDAGDDVPDWLTASTEAPASSETAAADEPAVIDEPAELAAPAAADVPDWLAGAGALADEDDTAAAEESGVAELDWMSAADELLDDEEFLGDTPLVEAPSEAEAAPAWLADADELTLEDDDAAALDAGVSDDDAQPAWVTDDVELADDLLPDDDAADIGYGEWQDIQEEDTYEPSVEEQLAEEVPDWFATAGPADDAAADAPAVEPVAAADGPEFVPDWYLGLDEQDTSDAPEWFGNLDFSADALTAQPVLPTPPEPEIPPEPAAQDTSGPAADSDLLAGVSLPPVEPAAGDAPDWLADVGQVPAAIEPDEDLPDWFADISTGAAPPAGAVTFAGPGASVEPVDVGAPAEDTPDWLAGAVEPAEEPPEWLADVGEPAPDLPVEPVVEAAVPSVEVAPADDLDFLAEELAPAEDLPDWFGDMGEAVPADVASPAVDAAAPSVEGVPSVEGAPIDVVGPVDDLDFLAEELAPAEDLPDWFGDMGEAAPAAEVMPPVEEPAPALAPGEAPDWLDGLSHDDAAAVSDDALFAGGEDFMAVIDGGLGADEGLPVAPENAVLSLEDSTFGLDDLLGVDELPPVDEPIPTDEQAPPDAQSAMAEADMPDWLVAAQSDQMDEAKYSVVGASLREQEASEGELSARLLALRVQTEGIVSQEATPAGDEVVATPEVLSGVADSLQPTAVFDDAEGRTALLDVQLDKQQEAQVATLAALLGVADLHDSAAYDVELDEDGEPLPRPETEELDAVDAALRIREADRRSRARSSRKPLRLVVTLILFVAIVLPFFVDFSGLIDLPVPALNPALHGEMDGALQSLRSGDMVLVGFEYGPTVAGEMDPLAEALLTHVLLRGAKPVIVSTKAAGILHAADVLDELAHDEFLLAHLGRSANEPLTMPDDYVLLSYLPGGIVGLRALTATSTDAAALDRGLFLTDYQGNATDLNVQFMQTSFPLGLTLAERGEDVRNWVEQVGAALDLPLVAGVSVAAEPVARPYLDSGQLLGLLSGYRDAYIYNKVLLAALAPLGSGRSGSPLANAQRLLTNTPTPTLRATATATPSPAADEALAAETAGDELATVELSEDEQTATALASGTPSSMPSATPRVIATFTAGPEGDAVEAPTIEPTAVIMIAPGDADQPLADERWYSMTLGALAIVGIISGGAFVNIIRSRRRKP
ncbi:hypothetical protein ACFLYO_03465 [Chloroflexota bacterium]